MRFLKYLVLSPQTQLQTLPTSPSKISALVATNSAGNPPSLLFKISSFGATKAAPECPNTVAKITQMLVGWGKSRALPTSPSERLGNEVFGHTFSMVSCVESILRDCSTKLRWPDYAGPRDLTSNHLLLSKIEETSCYGKKLHAPKNKKNTPCNVHINI